MSFTHPSHATVVLLFAATSTALAAPRPKATEELTYTPPVGWERTEQERLVIFTPPNVPPTRCALIVTPGENLEGDFGKWFRTKWDALRKNGKVVQGGERTAMEGPNGSSAMIQAALVESEAPEGRKKRTGLLLYAFNIGSAVHWVAFRTDGPDLFNEHKKTVNKFLAGLKFVETTTGRQEGTDKPKQAPSRRAPESK